LFFSIFKQTEQVYHNSVLCIHFLGLLLVLFYFSAYKFNNKDYCESYSEIVHHAEKDFMSVKKLLWELIKRFIIQYSL